MFEKFVKSTVLVVVTAALFALMVFFVVVPMLTSAWQN